MKCECQQCDRELLDGDPVRIIVNVTGTPDGDVNYDDWELYCSSCKPDGKLCILTIRGESCSCVPIHK